MNDPIQDIPEIIDLILGSKDTYNSQDVAKYYCEQVEFKNFMTYIPSGRCSRDRFVALNRCCRGYRHSDNKTTVHEVFFNEEHHKVVIDVTHFARRGVFFWVDQPIRVMIKLDLTYGNDGKYVIKRQEVLCQPEEIAGTIAPYLVPSLLILLKSFFTTICIVVGKSRALIGCK
ncbi:745_t:CDS:2 [Dentiscutata erythropus]|uniref:745_t:CDS:1 n=1 Tax=Dentiscutata erythropus TaxID=1348616 RepID=A0A9N9E3A8_9GLOM|nr:745_t:CDS:2 [Dentiscutata erythropus]